MKTNDDIKQALKAHIKELEAELARSQRALAALEPVAKPAAPRQKKDATAKAAATLAGSLLPERITEHLSKNASVAQDADFIAGELKASTSNVRKALKKLVEDGELMTTKQGRTTYYTLPKAAE